MRSEINTRSEAQQRLISLSPLASGGVGSFVLTDPDRRMLSLVLTFICPVLGALWLDHARSITNIGVYFSTNLWPQLRDAVGRTSLTTREDWIRVMDRSRVVTVLFVGPLVVVFVVPAVAGLGYSWGGLTGVGYWVFWVGGLVLTVSSVAYWIAYFLDHTVLTHVGAEVGEQVPVEDSTPGPIRPGEETVMQQPYGPTG